MEPIRKGNPEKDDDPTGQGPPDRPIAHPRKIVRPASRCYVLNRVMLKAEAWTAEKLLEQGTWTLAKPSIQSRPNDLTPSRWVD